jgi:ribosomal protein L40E
MRGGIVAAGILMMIIGIGGWIFIFPAIGQLTGVGGLVGVITGLILGPVIAFLGFLVFIVGLAVSPPQKPQPIIIHTPASSVSAHETLVICPECGARVSSKSKFCPECGEDLMPKQKEKFIKLKATESEEELRPAKRSKINKKAGFCIYCGAELHEGSKFCHKCGKEVKKTK